MADLPLPQIREKKFRQQEINLDQFTDEELCSKNRFGRESIQYLVEILYFQVDEEVRFPLLVLWFNLDHSIFRHFPLLHPCLNIFRAILFKSNHPKNQLNRFILTLISDQLIVGLFRFQELLFNPRLVIRGIRKLIVDLMLIGGQFNRLSSNRGQFLKFSVIQFCTHAFFSFLFFVSLFIFFTLFSILLVPP